MIISKLSFPFFVMVTFLSYADAGGSVEECVVDMVNSVEDGSHPSSRFPVPDYYRLVIKCLPPPNSTNSKLRRFYRAEVNRWLTNLCHELESEVPRRLIKVEEFCDDEKTKYVFKSYDASAQCCKPLVLLEENRDPLSQGTTGLISWQGAVLLSAWSDSFGDSVLAGKRVLELGRFLPVGIQRKQSSAH